MSNAVIALHGGASTLDAITEAVVSFVQRWYWRGLYRQRNPRAGCLRDGRLRPTGGRGSGGLIAIDREGNVVLPFNSEGMYRAYAFAGDTPSVGIYR